MPQFYHLNDAAENIGLSSSSSLVLELIDTEYHIFIFSEVKMLFTTAKCIIYRYQGYILLIKGFLFVSIIFSYDYHGERLTSKKRKNLKANALVPEFDKFCGFNQGRPNHGLFSLKDTV